MPAVHKKAEKRSFPPCARAGLRDKAQTGGCLVRPQAAKISLPGGKVEDYIVHELKVETPRTHGRALRSKALLPMV